jgi:hypothetical protein
VPTLRFFLELPRVLIAVRTVERNRRSLPLHAAIRSSRRQATTSPLRSPESRRGLKRAIVAVDARYPGGPNCLRRSLLEMALDRGAAAESLFAGFKAGGGQKSGHAWLMSDPSPTEQYDTILTI